LIKNAFFVNLRKYMVNDNRDSIQARMKILSLLRSATRPLSGEILAGELGMSRVAVWKHIKALEEHGYRFTAEKRGYTLLAHPQDSLLPWDLDTVSSPVSHFPETDSTMNRALEAAIAGAADGSLFIAERQKAGRGTGSKAWESVEGGLFFTLLIRPSLQSAHYFRSVTAAQCALVETLRDHGIKAVAAWPNDILARNEETGEMAKAGGILCEHLCSGNSVRFLNLGIGMNTGNLPELGGTARLAIGRRDLLEGFLRRMTKASLETPDLEARWNALSAHHNRECRLVSGGTVLKGLFKGLDPYGNARMLLDSSSEERRFQPGSVSILHKGTSS